MKNGSEGERWQGKGCEREKELQKGVIKGGKRLLDGKRKRGE